MNPLVQIYQKEDDPAVKITEKMQASVNSEKRASCSKSASHLLYCYQQADVRMRWHCLLPLDDNSLLQVVNNLMQVDCRDFLSARLRQVVSAYCSQWRCQVSEFRGGGGGFEKQHIFFRRGSKIDFTKSLPLHCPNSLLNVVFVLFDSFALSYNK